MAQNIVAVTLGEGDNDFALNSRIFVVDQAGATALGDSGLDLSPSTTSSDAARALETQWFTQADVTARDCTIKLSRFLDQRTNPAQYNVILENCIVMMDNFAGFPFWQANLTATNCTFMYTGRATAQTLVTLNDVPAAPNAGWGLFGNQTHDARVRPWVLNNCTFMTLDRGHGYFLINAIDPNTSVLNNVSFQNATGTNGTYIELPPIDAVGNSYGDFFRTDLGGLTGDNVIVTVTGGTDREDRDRTTGFIMHPQTNFSTIAQFDTNKVFAADGNVNLWLPNLYLPGDFNNFDLQFNKRQNSGTTGGGDDFAEFHIGHTWNPEFISSDGAVTPAPVLWWNNGTNRSTGQFRIFPMPATKSNAPGANDVPNNLGNGSDYGTANGLFIEEYRFTSTATEGDNAGQIDTAYIDKPIRVYDFLTQTGSELGQTITLRMPGLGETLATATNSPLVNEMTRTGTAIGYSSTDTRTFTTDPNIPAGLTFANATAGNSTGTVWETFENWYGMVKAEIINEDHINDAGNPIEDSEAGVLDIDRQLSFAGTTDITSTMVRIRVQGAWNAINADSTVTTLRMSGAGSQNIATWTRAFPSGIRMDNGFHLITSSTPLFNGVNWTALNNPSFQVTVNAGTYNFEDLLGNLTVEGGARVTFTSSNTITVRGTQAQRDMLQATLPNNITFTITSPPVTNTLNIPTTIGARYAIRVAGVEVRAPVNIAAGAIFTSPTLSSNTYNAGDLIEVFIKYNSDLSTRTVYQEVRQTFMFDDSANRSFDVVIPTPVPATLVESSTTSLDSNITLSAAPDGNNLTQTITSVNGNPLNVQPQAGLAVAISIAEQDEYFDAWYRNRATTTDPIFTFGQREVVSWDATRITFASGNTSTSGGITFRVQHILRNWDGGTAGTFSLARTGANEISAQIAGPAELSTVIAAVDASNLSTTVDGLNSRLSPHNVQASIRGGSYLDSGGTQRFAPRFDTDSGETT